MPDIQKLLSWFNNNKRDLPWRTTSDPYRIWLSEIILQQTRVDQGLSYYERFVEKYPSIAKLANAREDEVLKLWQGLGYYSRARNLHKTAKIILSDFKAVFPSTYNGLIKLPGIGPYTAAAISSIAFGRPHPVMDGNVLRVVSRWFAIHQPVDRAIGKNAVFMILKEFMDGNSPGHFNQAMMEFGATYCLPANPDCPNCIFNHQCMAFHSGKTEQYPVKITKKVVKNRYFNYLMLEIRIGDNFFTILRKRTENDIWKGLYEFPLIEAPQPIDVKDIFGSAKWRELTNQGNPAVLEVSDEIVHKLTHQRIYARFVVTQIENPNLTLPDDHQLITIQNLQAFPVSRLTERFLIQSGWMKRV